MCPDLLDDFPKVRGTVVFIFDSMNKHGPVILVNSPSEHRQSLSLGTHLNICI